MLFFQIWSPEVKARLKRLSVVVESDAIRRPLLASRPKSQWRKPKSTPGRRKVFYLNSFPMRASFVLKELPIGGTGSPGSSQPKPGERGLKHDLTSCLWLHLNAGFCSSLTNAGVLIRRERSSSGLFSAADESTFCEYLWQEDDARAPK